MALEGQWQGGNEEDGVGDVALHHQEAGEVDAEGGDPVVRVLFSVRRQLRQPTAEKEVPG